MSILFYSFLTNYPTFGTSQMVDKIGNFKGILMDFVAIKGFPVVNVTKDQKF